MADNTRESLINLMHEQLNIIVNSYESEVPYKFFIVEDAEKYEDTLEGNEVFIVYNFGNGTMGYNQLIQPVSINVACNQNYKDEVIKILTLYTDTYNLNKGIRDSKYIIQSYTTPAVNTRFEHFDKDYSVVCYFNGTFVINPNVSPIKTITIGSGTHSEVPFVQARLAYSNSQDARPVPGLSNSYARTINQFGNLVLSVSTYFDESLDIINDCIKMTDSTQSLVSQDKSYTITIGYGNNQTLTYTMKVADWFVAQTQDGLPTFELTMILG